MAQLPERRRCRRHGNAQVPLYTPQKTARKLGQNPNFGDFLKVSPQLPGLSGCSLVSTSFKCPWKLQKSPTPPPSGHRICPKGAPCFETCPPLAKPRIAGVFDKFSENFQKFVSPQRLPRSGRWRPRWTAQLSAVNRQRQLSLGEPRCRRQRALSAQATSPVGRRLQTRAARRPARCSG